MPLCDCAQDCSSCAYSGISGRGVLANQEDLFYGDGKSTRRTFKYTCPASACISSAIIPMVIANHNGQPKVRMWAVYPIFSGKD